MQQYISCRCAIICHGVDVNVDFMLIGIVGAPNKGKSTLFCALTATHAEIADYPFTTIDPNRGIAYVKVDCPCKELSVKCAPRNSLCINHKRHIPINVIDIAGLVEGAHLGKGMGNRFLNDISLADALIIVADASGKTDTSGNRCDACDPVKDVDMVIDELSQWVAGIIKKHIGQISRGKDLAIALAETLAGLSIPKSSIDDSLRKIGHGTSKMQWNDEEILRLATDLIKTSKPFVVAANKIDTAKNLENMKQLYERFGSDNTFELSAAIEFAEKKAEETGVIRRLDNGAIEVNTDTTIDNAKRGAAEYIVKFFNSHSKNMNMMLNYIVFNKLDHIIVYPVEDENRYSDSNGAILPDALLIKRGSTAHDMAMMIHTEIGNRMLYAIDARKKMKIGKEHVLNDGDIIKIVSAAK